MTNHKFGHGEERIIFKDRPKRSEKGIGIPNIFGIWCGGNERINMEGYEIEITEQPIGIGCFGRGIFWQNEEPFLSPGNEFIKLNWDENSI